MSKISIRKDLLDFIKRPDYNTFDNISIKDRFFILFKIFVFTYIGLIIAGLPYLILVKSNLIPALQDDYMSKIAILLKTQPESVKIFKMIIIFLTPIMSGFMFFNSQTKFKLLWIKISISLILGLLLTDFIYKLLWYPSDYLVKTSIVYLYIALFSFVFYFLVNTVSQRLDKYEDIWNSNFNKVFYSISIIFALVGIPRYLTNSNNFISIMLGLFPSFVYGFMFGYTRIRLGLVDSIVLYIIFLMLSFGIK